MIDTQAIRRKILDLAMRGKLTEQLPEDGTAEELYRKIQAEKQALIKAGKIKKEKPLPEIAADEVPFEIPKSWKWVRLAGICSIINGDRGKNYPAKSTLKREGIPFISALNLNGVSVTQDEHLLCLDDRQYKLLGNGKLQKDDIVICIRGSLGKHGRYPFEKGAIASSLVISRLFYSQEIMGDYEMIWLDSSAFPAEIERYDNGTAQPNLAANDLVKFLLPLPPLAEQHRIVARIEQAFSALDTIDTLQAKYADNLAVLKSKLIDAAIQGKLTEQLPEDGTAEELYRHLREKKRDIEDSGILKGRKKKTILPVDDVDFPFPIPATWKWIRLDSIAEIFGRIGFRGYTKSDIVKQGEGAISLSPSNITIDGKCVYDKCTYITWEKYEESPEIIVAEEDLIIVKTGSSYGKCGVVKELPEKATINPQLALLKYILCNRYYLHLVLNSTMARKQYEDFVVGAATPTFSQEDLSNFILPLPPLTEQKRIVDRINELLAVCDELK